mmetsp:Transcript_9374/g.27007  ORF Transcript_9374/g.27007 Transcript_9374/m.27007 type:complete len:264 (-) Transcript_9374:1005-1796(-)
MAGPRGHEVLVQGHQSREQKAQGRISQGQTEEDQGVPRVDEPRRCRDLHRRVSGGVQGHTDTHDARRPRPDILRLPLAARPRGFRAADQHQRVFTHMDAAHVDIQMGAAQGDSAQPGAREPTHVGLDRLAVAHPPDLPPAPGAPGKGAGALRHGLLEERLPQRTQQVPTVAGHHRTLRQVLRFCSPSLPHRGTRPPLEPPRHEGRAKEDPDSLLHADRDRFRQGGPHAQQGAQPHIDARFHRMGGPPWLPHRLDAMVHGRYSV